MKVEDAERITTMITETSHLDTDECECKSCMKMEIESNCLHPHSCSYRAKEMIDTLPEKWNPRAPQPDNTLTMTKENEMNREAELKAVFNFNLATNDDLANIFRIFTAGPIYNQTYRHKTINTPLKPAVAFIKKMSWMYTKK